MYTMMCSVSGIRNKECKTQLKNALDKVKGVQKVGVSLGSGTVQIDYNQPATSGQLKECIENTGFKVEYE